jgi:hypothetical protein
MLVFKYTFEYKKFFSKAVFVAGEFGVRCIANQAGGASDFITIAFKHFSVNALDWGRKPRQCITVNG